MAQSANIFARQLGDMLAQLGNQISQHALATDPILAARLARFAGRCIEFQSTAPLIAWHFVLTDEGIKTFSGSADAPHAVVSGSAAELLQALLPGGKLGPLSVEGDSALVFELMSLLRNFTPDISTPLGRIIGDVNAATLVSGAQLGIRGLQAMVAGLTQTAQQQATSQYVKTDQLGVLLTGIDELRLRVDRLAANIHRVEQAKRQADQL